MKKYKLHIVWGIVAVVALVGGIFWGKSMASAVTGTGRTGRFAFSSSTAGGFAGRNNFGSGGGFATGQVTAIDADSITLQLPNGNSENVFYSSSTQVVIPQPGSISSVKTGSMVMIGGTQNSDGSLTASTIQIRSVGQR